MLGRTPAARACGQHPRRPSVSAHLLLAGAWPNPVPYGSRAMSCCSTGTVRAVQPATRAAVGVVSAGGLASQLVRPHGGKCCFRGGRCSVKVSSARCLLMIRFAVRASVSRPRRAAIEREIISDCFRFLGPRAYKSSAYLVRVFWQYCNVILKINRRRHPPRPYRRYILIYIRTCRIPRKPRLRPAVVPSATTHPPSPRGEAP